MTYEEKWEKFYLVAQKFYKENGHLDIPKTCIIDDVKIGFWINNQRWAFNCNDGSRKITKEQIEKLNQIEMIWRKRDDWNINYELVKIFYETYNNLDIPEICQINDIQIDGLKLKKWLNIQRASYKKKTLSKEKINKLNDVGINWNLQESSWDNFYRLARQYYLANGNLDIPQNYEVDNKKLGKWINRQRQALNGIGTYKITRKQIQKLDEIGMIWDTKKNKYLHMNASNATNKYYIKKRLLIMLEEIIEQMCNETFTNKEDVKKIEKNLIKKLS